MFKSVRTFMRRAMHKGNTFKTTVAQGTFVAATAFGLAIVCMVLGVLITMFHYRIDQIYWEHNSEKFVYDGYKDLPEEYKGFLFVNAPSSFPEFLYKNNANAFFSYKYEEMDAPYDFVTVGQLMRLHNCGSAIVFPKNSDELLSNGEKLEVLTYIRTDRTELYDANEYQENILKLYDKYITAENGNPQITIKPAEADLTGVSTTNPLKSSLYGFIAVVPLIIFIIILYTVMTGGTNVIAGEKERGTFAAIILTPSPRAAIVVGNVLGISALAVIPASIVCFLAFLLTGKFNVIGLVIAILLVISFAILVAAITILISIINQSVVSAQTAFLPVFLIILGIAVNCVQKLGIFEEFYLYFPLYGHFFGIGNALVAGYNYYTNYIPGAVVCIVLSLVLACLVMFISTKLLYNEKFMTNEGGLSAKEIRKSKKEHKSLGLDKLVNHAIFPVAVLSFVQLLALVPTAITYMRNDIYSDFITNLKDVSGIMDIMSVMSEILAMFLSSPIFLISMAIGYVILIAIYCLKVRVIERDRKPLQSIGFTGNHALRDYLIGLVVGFSLLSAVCLILVLTGNLSFHGIAVNTSTIGVVLAGIPMWFVQGASEEIMFRGYMIPRLEKKFGKIIAILYSSFLFAVLHGANIGFTWLAGINLFIIAVFFALIYYYTGNIWLTCAAHTAWNFCQGSLYGLEVSGSTSGVSILNSSYSASASPYFTGGAFGPEGGLAVTIVTVIGIVIMSVLLYKKSSKK